MRRIGLEAICIHTKENWTRTIRPKIFLALVILIYISKEANFYEDQEYIRAQIFKKNSFTTAYPMNCQNKLVWQLGSVHKIHIHLEATSPLPHFDQGSRLL